MFLKMCVHLMQVSHNFHHLTLAYQFLAYSNALKVVIIALRKFDLTSDQKIFGPFFFNLPSKQ